MRAHLLAMAPKASLCLAALLLMTSPLSAGFDIVFKLIDAEQFDAEAIEALNAAFVDVEQLWEGIIQGHQHQDQPVVFEIEVGPTDESVASGGPVDPQPIGDFTLPTAGAVYVDPDWVVRATDGFVPAAAGINLLDELLAHEVGHALGIGALWAENGAYVEDSGQYTGGFGLEAYRNEFDSEASFVPVELAGSEGTANGHWDQLIRNSAEGDPDDPWVLSPLIGVVDQRGRDLGQELMSGSLDPDYGVPFLTNTTVQSLRDLGYDVIAQFPLPADRNEDGVLDTEDLDHLGTAIRNASEDLFYDINEDALVNADDHGALIALLNTMPGDSNFDLRFDSSDFIVAFQVGEYEDGVSQNSTWSDGDWTGDAEFDTADFIYAFQYGAYETVPALNQVPEPSSLTILFLGLITLVGARRRPSV